MNWQIISLPLIIIGVLLYSVCQKSIPKNANALLVITAAYFIALVISAILFLSKGDIKKEISIFSDQKWLPIILLGLSLPMVELGFLYAYRLGWKMRYNVHYYRFLYNSCFSINWSYVVQRRVDVNKYYRYCFKFSWRYSYQL